MYNNKLTIDNGQWTFGRKKKISNLKSQMSNASGQTLMELVIVVAVSVLVVGALVFSTISSIRNAALAKNQAQVTKLAQEGIERVRTGRDRNSTIDGIPYVSSWEDIWGHQFIGNDCTPTIPNYCYFNVTSTGILNQFTVYTPTPSQTLPSSAESIPPFKRAVMISDDAGTFGSQKIITVIVTWTDFSGSHESRLTTILRKL